MMESNKCYFFVDDIKSSFVYNELNNLSKAFKRVVVISKSPIEFPGNNVESVVFDYSTFKSSENLFANLFLILKIFITDVNFSKPFFNFKYFVAKVSTINRCVYLANKTEQVLTNDPDALYYSFWFNDWATVLSILKAKQKISNFFSRVHGSDLYEERVPIFKKIVLRKFQIKNVQLVFPISETGSKYLKSKYTEFQSKIFTSYLGTENAGPGKFNETDVFTIVSCAKIRNIKRIHLIPEILQHINFPIRWVHIGDENLNSSDPTIPLYLKNKDALVSNPNIEVVSMGNLSNEEVLKFYKENTVNLLISVSETEGLPISMMEAISFGIPVIATDVGGCNEIVNDTTGILISPNFDPSEVASQIEKFRNSSLNTANGRKNIAKFWQSNFDNEVNFKQFVHSCSK